MAFNILTAEISHETNTFNIHLTDIQDFEARYLLDGPAAIASRGGNNTELAGVLDIGRHYGWKITHTISVAAGPGGRVTDRALTRLCAPLLEGAAQGGWDGVLLMLHDYADNPGSGAYGDSTALLAAQLNEAVGDACFGPMVDPEVAQALQSEAVGNCVTLLLGGKTALAFGGGPIKVTGTVHWVGDGVFIGSGPILGGLQRSCGATAILRVQGIDILIVTIAQQILDLRQFEAFGIDPRNKTVVALKSVPRLRLLPVASSFVTAAHCARSTTQHWTTAMSRVLCIRWTIQPDVWLTTAFSRALHADDSLHRSGERLCKSHLNYAVSVLPEKQRWRS